MATHREMVARIGGADDLMFRSHALRVAALSVRLGGVLGLRAPELVTLGLAAKLHDVGKLTVEACPVVHHM